ncbi:MAG: hypothetical protein M3O15_10295 [Acidobacteriota bacterium]|nr:hypothetical protein [Acidobacteriota bacterium]
MWCHGSSGILLGKLATLPLEDSVDVQEEIRGGLEDLCQAAAKSDAASGGADDVCCGRMGHVEALLYAYEKLGEARYLAAAQKLVVRAWHRRRREGRYKLTAARGTDLFSPSLFQGLAGVGYTCLRLAMPRELPCLALLE